MTPRTSMVSCSASTAAGRPCDDRIDATALEHVLVCEVMGFLQARYARRRLRRVDQGQPLREDPPHGQALGRGRLRHTRRDAPVLRRQDPALHPRRLAVRARHRRRRRFHQRGALVDRTDRVREGSALHDVVRGRGSRLRLRAVEQPVLPATGVDPLLVAAQHHSAATLA